MKERRAWLSTRATAVIFAVGFAFVVSGWHLESGSALEPQRSYRHAKLRSLVSLLPKAQENGQVRVIVELDTPFKPEGDFNSQAEALEQRREIRNVQRAIKEQLTSPNSIVLHEFKYLPLMTLRVNSAGLEALALNPLVRSIHEDEFVRLTLAESVPIIGADEAWAAGYSGSGQVVAILDSGVDGSHEFLSEKVVAEACFSTTDEATSRTTVCPNDLDEQIGPGAGAPCSLDECFHGTHVAGIAVGSGAEFSGVAREARLIAIQVGTRIDSEDICGRGNSPCLVVGIDDSIQALEWVYEQSSEFSIAVVNMSFAGIPSGSNCDSDLRKRAIDQLRSVGIASVAASGNNARVAAVGAPACISTAISVGSTDKSDNLSFFSNVASFISLLAPGEIINSSLPGNSFGVASGTSMAAPHVTGAWAILKSKDPAASVDEVLRALRDTGAPVDDTREGGIESGMPRIQVDAALAALAPPTPTPTHSPTPTEGPNLVLDGGFELGSPNPVWNESSSNFPSPLCTAEQCGSGGGTGPHSGDWWSWFGGIGEVVEEGSVDQDIVIPPGTSSLSFWLEIPAAAGTGTDTFSVSIDSNVIFSATDLNAEAYSTYMLVTVDVSEFGDCESHNLKFAGTTLGSDITNFFVDDIVLQVVEPDSCDLPTATPTHTPTSTDTPTATATHTSTPEPTATSTETLTPTIEPSATSTETLTPLPAPTDTHTPSVEPSATSTAIPVPSPTAASATPTPMPGDLNQDGGVNVLDVQLCVNVFLGTEKDPGIVGRSDVNGDESVNVLDVQLIVNIFLEG